MREKIVRIAGREGAGGAAGEDGLTGGDTRQRRWSY